MRSTRARANLKKLPPAGRADAICRAAVMEALELRQLMSVSPVLSRVATDAGREPSALLSAAQPLPAAVTGTTLYDSQGFEPSKFTTGNLVGQDPVQGPWLKFEAASGAGTVETGVAATGAQALQIDRQNGQDVRFAPIHPFPTITSPVEIDWSMNVQQSNGAQPFGPFMGVEAYNDQGNGVVKLIGSAGVDAKTGEVLFQHAGTGFLDTTGVIVSFGVFHNFKLLLNFSTQQYQVFVDNTLVQTEGFVDGSLANPITGFSDADVSALAAAADPASQRADARAYVDDYKIQTPGGGVVFYDSQSFEQPTFQPGDIRGQDPAHGPWRKFSQPTGQATVENTVVANGTQAVRVDRQNGLDVRFAPYHPVQTVTNLLIADWTMRVEQATGPQPYGPFFGEELYDDQGNGSVRLIGSAGVDAKTGEVLFQHASTGFLDTTGVTVSLGVFHTFRVVANYQTQQYSIYVDNGLVKTEGFVDGNLGNPITGFSDADISALAASGDPDSQAANVTAYFDDYKVAVSTAPLVTDYTVDDGNPQRSKVRSLTVQFSEPVTLSPGAFTLALLNSGGSGTNNNAPDTDATSALGTPVSNDGGITWKIPVLANTAFSDAFSSLQDGIYRLTVHANKVTDSNLQQMPGDQSLTFHRLFGDINGNKTVNATDYNLFRAAFGKTTNDIGYNPYFDYNDNGNINAFDYNQFRGRFGKQFTY